MQDNLKKKSLMVELIEKFITMVLDVVELRALLINPDHRLLNVLDYEMRQPIKDGFCFSE